MCADSGQDTLDRDTERLAARRGGARPVVSSGVPVRWHLTEQGFVFEGVEKDALPSHWLASGIQVQGRRPTACA